MNKESLNKLAKRIKREIKEHKDDILLKRAGQPWRKEDYFIKEYVLNDSTGQRVMITYDGEQIIANPPEIQHHTLTDDTGKDVEGLLNEYESLSWGLPEEIEIEKEMKLPLYALLIATNHRMRTSILYGGKAITIREGHRDYKAGRPVMICCHLEPWAVMADITEVRHTTITEVTKEEYEADDFFSRKDLLKGLQKYYPNITMDSPVTVIKWKNVRGWLKDNDTKYRLHPQKLYSEINPTSLKIKS